MVTFATRSRASKFKVFVLSIVRSDAIFNRVTTVSNKGKMKLILQIPGRNIFWRSYRSCVLLVLMCFWVVNPANSFAHEGEHPGELDLEGAQLPLHLTPEEEEFLRKGIPLRMSEVDWEPLSIIDDEGHFRGIIADYMRMISVISGLKFEFSNSESWADVLEKYTKNELDIIPALSREEMVGREVLFSDVYVSFPLVIVTGDDYGTVQDLSQFNGKRVAAGKSYTSYHYIEDNYPEIELVGTADVEDGLLLLTKGQVDAFVGHLAVVVDNMNRLGMENLKIAGTANFDFEHRIGVSPDYPLALSIINKSLAAISDKTHREIRKKWFDVRFEQDVNYEEILFLFAAMVIALATIIFWNRKLFKLNESLNKEVARRRRMEKAHSILYEIALSVSRVSGIDEFYSIVQGQVNKLMYARNFYIAAYDRETEIISFPYFSDEAESVPEPRKIGVGLTDFVVRTGEPLFGDFATRMKLRDKNEYALVGPEANIWLGVPLKLQGDVVGVMVVQSYNEEKSLDERDFEVLLFLSTYVGLALERLHLLEQGREQTAALKEREIKYRAVFDNASDAILLIDLDNTIISANPEAVSMFRCGSEEELLAHNPENLLSPNQMDGVPADVLFDEWVKTTMDAGGIDFDVVCMRLDGEEFFASVRARKMVISGTTILQATLSDVTEKRRSKEEIERSVSLLTATIESSADGILAVDGYGQVVAWNARFSSMWNISEHVLQSGVVSDVFGYIADQVEDGGTDSLWDYSLESETGQVEELSLNDGRIIEKYSNPQRIGADVVGRVWSFRDVTSKRLSERELQDSYQRLNDIIEFLPDPTIVIDSDGIVLAWNKAVEEVSGVSKNDMIGKGNHEYALPFYGQRRPILIDYALIDDLETDPLMKNYESLERRSGLLYGEVYTPRAFQGQGAYFWGVAGPLRDHTGKIVGAVECMRNVTERRRVETELNRARIAAESATRAKSEFLANMSHEIRTPMNSIIGFGHLMQSAELEPAHREYLNKMMSSADSLLSIIGDILDFSKIEAGKFVLENVEFKMDHVLEKICNMVAVKAEGKGIDFVLSVEPEVPFYLRGDPLRLEQVLTNLVNNAVKFTEKGEVSLIVSCEKDCTSNARIKFTVRDSGIGLSSEEISNLFDSFTQADASTTRKYGGTGLGLAITRSLVELMGGTVSVESQPEVGSSFYFTIGLDSVDKGIGISLPGGKEGLKVLVVESSRLAREFIRTTLDNSSFRVAVDSTASSALERLKSPAGREELGLILMSCKLSDMRVLEAVKRIKDIPELEGVPVVLMAPVNVGEAFRREATLIGVDGFVSRPVTRLSLHASLLGEFSSAKLVTIAEAAESTEAAPLVGQRAKILLVEDNELNQQVARRMLEGMGVAVDVAENGRKALEALETEVYNLIIMDIQMPEMDGLTAAKMIRAEERYRGLPILAMTAHAMPGDRTKSFEAGMNEHLTKPIDPDELRKALDKYLEIGGSLYEPDAGKDAGAEGISFELPGIDSAKGLRNIGGREDSYLKVLLGFKERYADFRKELEEALDESGSEQALLKIHSLKGVAGNIGADKLYELCRILEGDLRDEDRSGYEKDLKLFVSELDLVIKGLEERDLSVEQEDREYVYDEEKSFNLINKLYIMLDEGDAESVDVLDELRIYFNLEGFEDQLAELTRHIENFDFDDARDMIERIADKLSIPLDKG